SCWCLGSRSGLAVISKNLVEHWDGGAWSIVDVPNGSTSEDQLNAVTCVSESNCWTVGSSYGAPLIEHWDGSAWTIAPSPTTSGMQTDSLNAVNCTSALDCWAVGKYESSSTFEGTLIEHWNGLTWSIVSSPNPSASGSNVLNSVDCNSLTDCWAVGYQSSTSSSPTQPLLEHWDGVSWSNVIQTASNSNNYTPILGLRCSSS